MMKGVNLRMNATNKGGPAMASYTRGLKGIKKAQDSVKRTNVGFMKGMNANRRIVQQVGMQVSDLGVQIAGGQSALLSLTQNVPQVVQMFGAWGGILAAIITLMGTFTLVMVKSGKGINDILPFMGALEGEFTALAKGIGVVKEAFLDGVNLIINNLDVLFISLSILAAFMVKKWVVSFLTSTGTLRLFNVALLVTKKRGIMAGLALIKARGGALLFAGALKVVKKAIITTGIGALIVGAGYLIERLFTLKQATGSWGETFKVVGDLIKQVFMQLPTIMGGVFMKIKQFQLNMGADFTAMLADVLEKTGKWADPMIGVFVGVYNAVKELFRTFGSVIINPFVDGINGLIDKARTGINKLIEMMNKIPNVNIPLIPPDVGKISKIVIDDTKTLGERMKKAFTDGMDGTYVGKDGVLTKGMRDASNQTRSLADQVGALGDRMLSSAEDAIPAWKELKALLASVDGTDFDIRSLMGGKKGEGDGKDDPLDEIKKLGKDLKIKPIIEKPDVTPVVEAVDEGMEKIKDMGKAISRTFSSSFKGLIRGTKSFKDVIMDVLDTILDKMLDMMLNPIFDAIGGSIAGGIGGLFKGMSFDGGGFTGRGSRVGGMDGKGGKLAMVHPNESVVDHTKGQAVSADTTIHMNIYGVQDADSFRKSKRQIIRDIRNGLAA